MTDATPEPETNAGDVPTVPVADAAPSAAPHETAESPVSRVSTFAQGLLKIRVPLRVTLAAQRKSIQDIIELGPGAIVKFNKTCDEPLELSVGDRLIATGEVIKVGDKFGVRIGARK